MTQIVPTPRTLHFTDAVIEYRRYPLPYVTLEHETIVYPLAANWKDQVHVFEHKSGLYVLTINHQQPLLRLELFIGKAKEAAQSLTLTDSEELTAILGPRWRKLTPKTMAILLANQLVRKGGVA